MRKTLILIVFLLISFKSIADCANSGFDFWPEGNLNPNSLIIINGYGESQEVIRLLNDKYPIYLKAGKNKVQLEIKEILVGGFNIIQAVLKPEKELIVGQEYHIYIDNLPKNIKSTIEWENKLQGIKGTEIYSWAINPGNDIEKPIWIKKPTLIKKTLVKYGCGPATFVHFNFAVMDKSVTLINI
jgi:hypothetical protein